MHTFDDLSILYLVLEKYFLTIFILYLVILPIKLSKGIVYINIIYAISIGFATSWKKFLTICNVLTLEKMVI